MNIYVFEAQLEAALVAGVDRAVLFRCILNFIYTLSIHYHNHIYSIYTLSQSYQQLPCTSIIVIKCQSMLSVLWHLKADCDVQFYERFALRNLTVFPLQKSHLGPPLNW